MESLQFSPQPPEMSPSPIKTGKIFVGFLRQRRSGIPDSELALNSAPSLTAAINNPAFAGSSPAQDGKGDAGLERLRPGHRARGGSATAAAPPGIPPNLSLSSVQEDGKQRKNPPVSNPDALPPPGPAHAVSAQLGAIPAARGGTGSGQRLLGSAQGSSHHRDQPDFTDRGREEVLIAALQ